MAFDDVRRIVIAGVGLIGGSIGLALKRAGFSGEIVGLRRKTSSRTDAVNLGIVDSITSDYAEALRNAGLLLVCTPIGKTPDIVKEAVIHAPEGCVITDVGSAKRQLINEVKDLIPKNIHFVGAHPMAGSDKSGVAAATKSLFDGAVCIITPIESTSPEAADLVSDLWKSIGMRVEYMSPEQHDFLIAAASHLPHIVAGALVSVVDGVEKDDRKAMDFTGTGFADTTRIAAGNPEFWRDVLLQNAGNLSYMLEKIEKELAKIRKSLENRDVEALVKGLEQARQIRSRIRR